MTVYTYSGKLADFSDEAFPANSRARLWVEAVTSAMSGSSLHALKRVHISVASNGSFSVDLVASADLTPQSRYRIRCEWLDGDIVLGWTDWAFTALIGGGPIANMADVVVTNIWYSTVKPPIDRTGITWIHPTTGDVREWV